MPMTEKSKAAGLEMVERATSLLQRVQDLEVEKVEADNQMTYSIHESVRVKLSEEISMTIMIFTRKKIV